MLMNKHGRARHLAIWLFIGTLLLLNFTPLADELVIWGLQLKFIIWVASPVILAVLVAIYAVYGIRGLRVQPQQEGDNL